MIGKRGGRQFVESASPVCPRNACPRNARLSTKRQSRLSTKRHEWGYTHGDMEVYNSQGYHLGSADPETGQMTKPPVPGRTIDL